jgi:hypothetical protein
MPCALPSRSLMSHFVTRIALGITIILTARLRGLKPRMELNEFRRIINET